MKTYDFISRFNHWTVAIAFIGMLCVGLALEYLNLDQALKITLLKAHKATGVLLLLYGAWRVGYRIKQGFALPVSSLPAWQEKASKAVHVILLAGVILMPLSGLIMSLYSGRAIDIFGLVQIPPIGESKDIASFARAAHKWIAYSFIAAILAHIGAALKHHFFDKDQTLVRMIKGQVHK